MVVTNGTSSGCEDSPPRTFYSIDGRRVQVRDLLRAGLLKPGTELHFDRPRIGATYFAEVTDDGKLRLPNDQEFSSPSRAAMVAAGMRACDGWTAWTLADEGTTLDGLRQELLESVADLEPGGGIADAETTSTFDVAPSLSVRERHEYLQGIRSRATAEAPERLSVRQLVGKWGAQARGTRVIEMIEADLANHGLVTSPDFRKVTLDTTVGLFPQALPEADDSDDLDDIEVAAMDTEEAVEVGLTVGNLPSALGGLLSVSPNSSMEEAVTKMILNDFSQLAVLNGPFNLRGAVTWKSIAQARHLDADATVVDALVRAHDVPYSRDLIDVLPLVQEDDFVIVRDEHNAPKGIVTAADVVRAYGDMATPFFLLGEIDQRLRRLIARAVALEDICRLVDPADERSIDSFDRLTMGDYHRALQNQDIWNQLCWPLDRATFVVRLDEVRILRNDVMHFNPDPPTAQAMLSVRHFLSVLRMFGD